MGTRHASLPILRYVIVGLALTVAVLAGVRYAVRRANLQGRMRSPATIRVVEPAAGAVTGEQVRARFMVTGARVVDPSRTRIVPDEGHIHLNLDGRPLEMQYTTAMELRVPKGVHTLHVEFVASDHRPFNPRITTSVRFETK